MTRARRLLALLPLALSAACAAPLPEDSEIGTPLDPVPARGTFRIDGEPVELEYERVGDTLLFEGDIALDAETEIAPSDTASEVGGASEALLAEPRRNLWPRGVIPYVIAPSVTTPARVRNAMREWERRTAIRFVPRRGQAAFVKFIEERGNTVCHANVGYTGGRRVVSLRDTRLRSACSLGVVVHEIGHVVGLWHEHTRSDRNEHVRVIWSNVGDRRQFTILTSGVRRVGPYDVRSTMHYRSFTLSSPSDRPSIVRRDGSLILHDWADLSPRDVASMERLYGPRRSGASGEAEPEPPPAPLPDDAGVDPIAPAPAPELDPSWTAIDEPAPHLAEPPALPLAGGCAAGGATPTSAPWLAAPAALLFGAARRRRRRAKDPDEPDIERGGQSLRAGPAAPRRDHRR